MSWYWIFYLLSVVDNLRIVMEVTWIISMLLSIAFTIIFLVNKHNIVEGYQSDKDKYTLWVTISKRVMKIFITLFITMLLVYIFTPSRTGILMIVAGGAVGEFVVNNEDAKELPAELTSWFRAELQQEVQEIKNIPIKKSIEKLTKQELQEQLLKYKEDEVKVE